MNTLLENLLIVFLKITLLSWLMWGLIGLVIVIVIIYIYISDKVRLDKMLPYAIPIIIIPLMIKKINNLLSDSELVEYVPMLTGLENINDILFIIISITMGLTVWNIYKEL